MSHLMRRKPSNLNRHPLGQADGKTISGRDFEWFTRCRILHKIADGGMGSVYLAEQLGEEGFAKTVALKVIRRDKLSDGRALQMFIEEAKLTADLVHSNIAQVYNLGQVDGQFFIVMEYLHARTVSQYLKAFRDRNAIPPLDMTAFIVSRVCRALSYAHTKKDREGRDLGIVHRDVTPSNVMMDFRGVVKLTDFGIAKAVQTQILDETKFILGKYPYMSPEQAAGQVTDGRSDLFSLGLVLYEMLTGTRVYTPKTRNTLLNMMNRYRIANPTKLNPEIPERLAEITMLALQKTAAERYESARAMGDDLEKHLYSGGYGPTNEKLAEHLLDVFPDVDRDHIY
jgi:serine/threonine protein kinase